MASSSGDDETSIETSSPESTRQDSRQGRAFVLISKPTTENAVASSRPAARPKRAFPQNGEWTQYKPLLRRLYMDEKKTLTEVREHMKTQYNFNAS